MFISSIQVQGTDRDIADAARTTIGLRDSDKIVSKHYMKTMYLCEHSPIRIKSFNIVIEDVKSWVATHFVRHHVGYTPYVSTQRDDRNSDIKDRDKEVQGNLVTLRLHMNAQAVINVSRKRLCTCAHPEARRLWRLVLESIATVDPQLVEACVPDCIYRGWCFEFKSCNFHRTRGFQLALDSYRKGVNGYFAATLLSPVDEELEAQVTYGKELVRKVGRPKC